MVVGRWAESHLVMGARALATVIKFRPRRAAKAVGVIAQIVAVGVNAVAVG